MKFEVAIIVCGYSQAADVAVKTSELVSVASAFFQRHGVQTTPHILADDGLHDTPTHDAVLHTLRRVLGSDGTPTTSFVVLVGCGGERPRSFLPSDYAAHGGVPCDAIDALCAGLPSMHKVVLITDLLGGGAITTLPHTLCADKDPSTGVMLLRMEDAPSSSARYAADVVEVATSRGTALPMHAGGLLAALVAVINMNTLPERQQLLADVWHVTSSTLSGNGPLPRLSASRPFSAGDTFAPFVDAPTSAPASQPSQPLPSALGSYPSPSAPHTSVAKPPSSAIHQPSTQHSVAMSARLHPSAAATEQSALGSVQEAMQYRSATTAAGTGGEYPVVTDVLPPSPSEPSPPSAQTQSPRGEYIPLTAAPVPNEILSALQGMWLTSTETSAVIQGHRVYFPATQDSYTLTYENGNVVLSGSLLLGHPVGTPVRLVWDDGDVWAREGCAIPTLRGGHSVTAGSFHSPPPVGRDDGVGHVKRPNRTAANPVLRNMVLQMLQARARRELLRIGYTKLSLYVLLARQYRRIVAISSALQVASTGVVCGVFYRKWRMWVVLRRPTALQYNFRTVRAKPTADPSRVAVWVKKALQARLQGEPASAVYEALRGVPSEETWSAVQESYETQFGASLLLALSTLLLPQEAQQCAAVLASAGVTFNPL